MIFSFGSNLYKGFPCDDQYWAKVCVQGIFKFLFPKCLFDLEFEVSAY